MSDPVLERGYEFDFLQAVRILSRLFPDRRPVGHEGHPSHEVVHFAASPSLAFPAGDIQSIAVDPAAAAPPTMTVNFMGLTGPLGALPYCYTELLMERIARKDYALRDFLDLFNHRAISLFHRASVKYRSLMGAEGAADGGISRCLENLAGMGAAPKLKETLRCYAGLFNQRPRSASGLECMLSSYFETPVHVEMFVGQWVALQPETRTRLGVQNSALGAEAIIGERIWDRQSKFRVKLGPLPLARFRAFLPGRPAFVELLELVRAYSGMDHDFDVSLAPDKDAATPCRLESDGDGRARLGWSSWLGDRGRSIDAAPVIIACDRDRKGPPRFGKPQECAGS